MSKILHGFGCKLLDFDLEENKNLINTYNMEYTTLEKLCNKADIISLHLPLNTETYKLINEELIYEMKEGVI